MEAALATVDVPRGAIVIDVGCEGLRQWPLDFGEPPDEAFLRAINYSLEVMEQASYGETVRRTRTAAFQAANTDSNSVGGTSSPPLQEAPLPDHAWTPGSAYRRPWNISAAAVVYRLTDRADLPRPCC